MLENLIRLVRYRELLYSFVARDLKARYKGSILGFFWSLLHPLALTAVYAFVFSVILRVKVEHFALFLLTGLFPWLYHSGVVLNALTCVVANGNLIKKVAFPTELLPISVTLAHLYSFILTLVVLLIFLFVSGIGIDWTALLLPFVILDQTLFVLGIAFVVSALFVYVRDIEHILSLLLTIWMYLTPVLYPLEQVPEQLHPYFRLNPMTLKIGFYRSILLSHQWPEALDLLISAGSSLACAALGYLVYTRYKGHFPEEV